MSDNILHRANIKNSTRNNSSQGTMHIGNIKAKLANAIEKQNFTEKDLLKKIWKNLNI